MFFYPSKDMKGYENNRELLHATKEEQNTAEGCRRLVKNALVCWNYLYLTEMVENEENPKKKQNLLDQIQSGSIAAWKHFQGEYDFSKQYRNEIVL